jgi:hypothetical protein
LNSPCIDVEHKFAVDKCTPERQLWVHMMWEEEAFDATVRVMSVNLFVPQRAKYGMSMKS